MPTELISRHDTICHRILDLEAELEVSTGPQKETLDILIEEARTRIQVKDAYTREDAVGILGTINSILQDNGFEQRDRNGLIDRYHLFHEGLGSKKIDCDNTSFIYLSIADALGLPIAAVSAPKHLFVRFMLNDGSYINWGSTTASVISDKSYKLCFNIADAAIKNGVFLKNLTHDGIIALAYNKRGNAWLSEGSFDKAIADYNEAIRLDRNNPLAYYNRGTAWFNKGNLDNAIADYNEAIRLDPNYAKARNNDGIAYYKRGIARHCKLNLPGAYADFIRGIYADLRAVFPIFR